MRGSLGFGGRPTRKGAARRQLRPPRRRPDRRAALRRGPRPSALPDPVDERRGRCSSACIARLARPTLRRDWILRGELSHKSQQVFEALLSSYDGSLDEVLKARPGRALLHLAALPRRRRHARPADERRRGRAPAHGGSLARALPPSLQALTLYEAKGELIDAAGGVLEFSDLLKRPLDTFKYLQLSVETGEVSLRRRTCSSTA